MIFRIIIMSIFILLTVYILWHVYKDIVRTHKILEEENEDPLSCRSVGVYTQYYLEGYWTLEQFEEQLDSFFGLRKPKFPARQWKDRANALDAQRRTGSRKVVERKKKYESIYVDHQHEEPIRIIRYDE